MEYVLHIKIDNITGDAQASENEITSSQQPDNPTDTEPKADNKNLSARAVAVSIVGAATFGANVYKQFVSVNSGDQNEVNKTNFIVDKGSKLFCHPRHPQYSRLLQPEPRTGETYRERSALRAHPHTRRASGRPTGSAFRR